MHYIQMGQYKGHITLDGLKFDVDGFIGVRDRTWRPPLSKIIRGGKSWGGHFCIPVHFAGFQLFLGIANYFSSEEFLFHSNGAILNNDGSVIPIHR